MAGQSGARGHLPRIGRIVRSAGPTRLAITLLVLAIALLIARFSWDLSQLPFLADAERAYYDVRAARFAPAMDQDERIVLIVYNDKTLTDLRKRSPLDRATLAKALTNIDPMGAKAIGIDILFDSPQDEDPALQAAFRAMKTPTFIGYTDTDANADQITFEQHQFLAQFIASLKAPNVHPASVYVETDRADGVMRRWPKADPRLPPLLARAMVPQSDFDYYSGSIWYRMPQSADRPSFASYPIDLFTDPKLASAFASQITGKYVLIGGDIKDTDLFETPLTALTGKEMIGLETHAQMLAQMLDRAHLRPVSSATLWMLAALAVLAAALSAMLEWRWWQIAPFALAQLAFFGGLPLWLQAHGTDTHGLPAIGWAVGWGIAFAAAGSAARAVGSEQRKFAQGALGKYLPRDIASQILAEPEMLALHGEKREIFVVFTDLEGFTKLSHAIPPETVATLLNRYLEMLSDVVLAHGGTIDKFVGDAVVAFWGAPISRPDDGRNAARAAYAMWQAGEEFRRTAPPELPSIGKTRAGLHWGDAIVGNFGGEGRIQYTALGDAMNTASRLESANKSLKSSVMASREAMERSGLDWWRPMGRVLLRGRSTPVDIFEPAPDFPESDRDHLQFIMTRLDTDRQAAIRDLAALAARYSDDAALQNLLYRIERSEAGEAYVLD